MNVIGEARVPAGDEPVSETLWLDGIVATLDPDERLILPVLQAVQRDLGYVPESCVNDVARCLNVSRAEVVGVLTYYHDLRTTPPAEVQIRICESEACQSVGSRQLRAAAHTVWGDSRDSRIDISTVYCLGNCALGPAVQVNGRLIGLVTQPVLAQAVDDALRSER